MNNNKPKFQKENFKEKGANYDCEKETRINKDSTRNERKDAHRRNGFKRFNKESRESYQGIEKQPKINDAVWYFLNEISGKAVGSIPYNVFAGQRLDLGALVLDNSTQTIPGVTVVHYCSTPGKSTSGASAVNIMSKAVYSFVRHQNSGHSNYESSDLTLYILAMDEIYTKYLEAKRIYEVAMTYDYANRNIPDVILAALGADADNIRANLAQFRYGLNILAAKISSMAVPANFNLFKRHAIISSAILMDSSSMRGQFYLWRQRISHKFNAEHTGGGALEAYIVNGNRTYTQLLQELSDMIDPVISDEDMNIMSGDIMKAYGKENLFVLPEVDEAATANFVYDENLLAQIENSCSEDPATDGTHLHSLDITQENNLIVFLPEFKRGNILTKRIFNSHKDDPDWKDTLEWSRGMTLNGAFGTELVMYYELFARTYDSQGVGSITSTPFNTFLFPATTNDYNSLIRLAAFDWHPIFYICTKNDQDQPTGYQGFYGDIKKMTILSDSEIERLHDSAVMGELNGSLLSVTR